MPVIILKFKDKVIKEFAMDKGAGLTIGRHDENDVVIDNLAVSGYHAKVDSVGEGFLLTDLQSKNGTFVNEQKVKSHYLNHNDDILVGKHSLVFAYREGETRPDNTAADLDRTMIMDTGKYKEIMNKNSSEKHTTKEGVLSILSDTEKEIRLNKKITRIGKAADSDIVVGGLLTGRTAATISKRPGGYFLSYVEGIKKPKVNGDTVTGSVELKEFDMLSIGSGKMQFMYKN